MMPVLPLSKKTLVRTQAKIDSKTKPLGALGVLEPLALQLALITDQRVGENSHINNASQISIKKPAMIVFAGDHGINENNLSIAPSAVTKQMVLNFLHGGAAINCFCQSNDIDLTVVDCGILEPLNPDEIPKMIDANKETHTPKFVEQRQGAGTDDFSIGRAMSVAQVMQGFDNANNLIKQQVEQGVEILLLGEMGIANTSSAAALMSALTLLNVEQCVGRGTGITDEQLNKKVVLIKQALSRLSMVIKDQASASPSLASEEVIELLSQLGGFEIVQMVSAILAGAKAKIPVVIDGFIVSVAALVAVRLDANVADYLIFSHVSQEKAHQALLAELLSAQTITEFCGQPLLDLGLRLGEGTGAALAFPLIKAAACFYNNMASFESAGVTV
jgi:nicotinate-nucleotide--dimethylbenzimidazole phosphoribosyltransferase